MSNTKLSDYEKVTLKHLKSGLRVDGGCIFTFDGMTIAVKPAHPGSDMARFAVSFASPNEKKLRAKVGEYHALNKMYLGEIVQVRLQPHEYETFAFRFADFFIERM